MTVALVFAAILFLLFGELFYFLLSFGSSRIRPLWLLWFLLVFLGPVVLVIYGAQDQSLAMLVLLLLLATAHLGLPRRFMRNFVERREVVLTSDIPFYDAKNHPIRTAVIVISVYWSVLVFFLAEFA